MTYKPSDEKCLGVYFEDFTFKAVAVSRNKGIITIDQMIEWADVKPLDNSTSLDPIKKLAETRLLISGLSGDDLLLRRLKLKIVKQKEIDDVFLFQAEPMLPYPIETAVLDKWTTEVQEDQSSIAFLSAKKEDVRKHLDHLEESGIDPEAISAYPVALTALAQFYTENAPLKLVIDIEKGQITCALIKHDKLIASHEITSGWQALYQASINARETNPPSIEEFFSTGLEEAPKEWIQEIVWNVFALQKETKSKEPLMLLITGEGANLPQLKEHIAEALETSPAAFNAPCPLHEFNRFALPLGLALSGLPSFKEKINFRQEEFAFKDPWKRFKKSLLLIGGLSCLLAFSIYLFTQSYIRYREDQLRERFLTVLSIAQKPYAEFEKQYEQKSGVPADIEPLPIQDLNAEALTLRLDALERQIRTLPDTFPLFPNTPRVSDVLAWLSSHPSFQCPEGKECPQVTIENFSYAMVKRPEMNKKNEKYQVKIDLEFTTSSPTIAREFHDALITPNDFIDPKGEIKWNATKGKYKTSFFLKDKTFYPTPLKGGS
jgi:type IV pilus assembly protein PilM